MTVLTYQEWTKIKDLKLLDIQQCSFCQKITILNLGWKPFKKLYCLTDKQEHILCPELCYKIALNILNCELYQKEQETKRQEITTNKKHYKSRCYLCSKELKGAGKTGKVKRIGITALFGI